VRVARRRTILWKLTASLTGEYGSNASRKARVSKNPSAVGLEPLSNDLNGVLPGCQPDRVGNELGGRAEQTSIEKDLRLRRSRIDEQKALAVEARFDERPDERVAAHAVMMLPMTPMAAAASMSLSRHRNGEEGHREGDRRELFHTTTLHPLTSTMDRAVARISGLLILSVLSTACNAAWLAGYTKQGVTDRQKSSDYYECRKESTVVRNRGKGMQEEVSDMDKLNSCMRARGYAVSVETPS